MKISLQQIKNIFMEVRDIDFFNENFNVIDAFTLIDDEKLNTICREITGKDYDYAGDLIGEEGAVEVISSFLLSILSSWEKSKNFRQLIKRFLPEKVEIALKNLKPLKSEQS